MALGFFNDVFIPARALPEGSIFGEDNVWMWSYEGQEFFFDKGEQVKVRVTDVQQNNGGKPYNKQTHPEYLDWMLEQSPMLVIGAMDESGLGCIRWWR